MKSQKQLYPVVTMRVQSLWLLSPFLLLWLHLHNSCFDDLYKHLFFKFIKIIVHCITVQQHLTKIGDACKDGFSNILSKLAQMNWFWCRSITQVSLETSDA